jgi:predicted phosphoribosyltransferase
MRRIIMFRDRAEAAHLLTREFKGRVLSDPLVLAIPRGGVVTGAVLARELGAELDVVLSRKLRAPDQPELAIGAVAEDGQVYLDPAAKALLDLDDEYVESERAHQLDEVKRRKALFRAVRPQALIEGRSVIVTDDGIATGATMMAALQVAQTKNAFELIVAVPVASPDKLHEIRRCCDEVICILAPRSFWAIGQFYQDFSPVEDAEAVELLRAARPAQRPAKSLT